MDHAYHQAEIDRDRRLGGQQRLDCGLDPDVQAVHLVIGGDHPPGLLAVAREQCVDHGREGAAAESSLVLNERLDLV